MGGLLGVDCGVNEGGYQWVEAIPETKPEGGTQPYLIKKVPLSHVPYNPMEEHPALYRIFAGVKDTREGILEFANRYGSLEGNVTEWVMLSNRRAQGESLEAWRREIVAMRHVVEVWDMISKIKKDIKALSQYVRWSSGEEQEKIYFFRPGGGENSLFANQASPVTWFEPIEQGDVIKPARYFISELINRHLHGRVAAEMLWASEANDGHGDTPLYFLANGLIATLWLQAARAIDTKKHYHNCDICGTPFETPKTSSVGKRPYKLYCSDACRQRAYRQRKASDTA